MEIKILHLLDGAKKANGLTVIIDVFRAFSTACYLFSRGVKSIIITDSIKEARYLKDNNNDLILVGERNGKKIKYFDFGNSPSRIIQNEFKDKNIVLTTSAGTRGIIAAKNSIEIVTASFLNADAVVNFLRDYKMRNKKISIVAMGNNGLEKNIEDKLCAEYIYNRLKGKILDKEKIINKIYNNKTSDRFFDKNVKSSPKKDLELCLKFNVFNFVLKIKKENKLTYLEKTKI